MQRGVKRATIQEEEKEDELLFLKKTTFNNVARDFDNENIKNQSSKVFRKNKVAPLNDTRAATGKERRKKGALASKAQNEAAGPAQQNDHPISQASII